MKALLFGQNEKQLMIIAETISQADPKLILDIMISVDDFVNAQPFQKYNYIIADFRVSDFTIAELPPLHVPLILMLTLDDYDNATQFLTTSGNSYLIKDNDYKFLKIIPSIIERGLKQFANKFTNLALSPENIVLAKKLELFLQSSNAFSWEINFPTQRVIVPESLLNMLGYYSYEIGISLSELIQLVHNDDRTRVVAELQVLAISHNAIFETNFRLVSKYGDIMWFNCHGRINGVDKNGKPTDMIGIVYNISDIKRNETLLEKALVMSESRQREVNALFQCTKSILESTDYQTSARTIYYSCKDLIHATSGFMVIYDPKTKTNKNIIIETMNHETEMEVALPFPTRGLRMEAYTEHKALFNNDFKNSEYISILPDGHIDINNVLIAPMIHQEHLIGLLAFANKTEDFDDHDAELAFAFGQLASIAYIEEYNLTALQISEKRYRSLFTNAQDMIFTLDNDSKFLDVNPCALEQLGYNLAELQQLSLTNLLVNLNPASFQRDWNRFMKEGVFNGELKIKTKAGKILDVEVHSVANFQNDNHLSIVRDITKRNQNTRQLENLIAELKKALDEIKTLQGIIPICAGCKKIRDDQGYWQQVETYIKAHTHAEFSHGLCPECIKTLYPELADSLTTDKK